MRRPHRLLAALGLTVAGLPLVGAAPAYAHATMVDSSPRQEAVLDALPSTVSFEFSEPMDPVAYVVVTAPDGTAAATGKPIVDGATVTQVVQDAGEGTYLMAVKAVSRDGHPITGRVEFVVGEPSERTDATAAAEGRANDSTPSSAATSTDARDLGSPTGWRGHRMWVWLVGPAFMAGGLALWVAASRSRRPGGIRT